MILRLRKELVMLRAPSYKWNRMISHLIAEQRSCDVPGEGVMTVQRTRIFADGGEVRINVGGV